jgi:hypothetical protein
VIDLANKGMRQTPWRIRQGVIYLQRIKQLNQGETRAQAPSRQDSSAAR